MTGTTPTINLDDLMTEQKMVTVDDLLKEAKEEQKKDDELKEQELTKQKEKDDQSKKDAQTTPKTDEENTKVEKVQSPETPTTPSHDVITPISPEKTIKKQLTVQLCHFKSDIVAVHPVKNVVYFNRKALKSKSHLFGLIDSTSFDVLTTDPWSSVFTQSEDWTHEPIEDTIVDTSVLNDRFNVETNRHSVTFHKQQYKIPIVDAESEYPFYETYFYHKKSVKHYIDKENMILLSVDESTKYKKAILRSAKEMTKLIIPPDTDIGKYRNIFPKNSKVVKYNNIPAIDEELYTIETMSLNRQYKFGVVYVKPNQDESQIFSNDKDLSIKFYELLDLLGDRIELKGFTGYSGGLDVRYNETGKESYCSTYFVNQVMFHVAPLLPPTIGEQQLERKRHVGNDIVVLVFLEEGVKSFDPRLFTSHFNHVFVIVQPINEETYDEYLRVSVVCKPSIPPFCPFIDTGVYKYGERLRHFLMQKLINGDRTTLKYPPFKNNAENTRRQQISVIAQKLSN
ncbi:rap GTPase-activating protein, putative [Entamoeba invadens IP1]|uniref:rap GTPase-activating protein, putative n=1 Tax=Entamoeba invadens IP1 TaxID=370355 RepID=UPI0002C3EC45|nr:rap GTPase-activating protein, putative [Entamoeba invadens IP1]ELP93812.1 rap GTPase-activating protein, putative [Entamoeba invadens IP1]|eukprot:XP_004260583.1 rap GTPase-activating protein, putative [Entamoeba invadens IP1]